MNIHWKSFSKITIGNLLFVIGLNLFIIPLNLYSGGLIGFAQIIRTLILNWGGISIASGVDIAGIINFILNIPLFVLAYKAISKHFFFKTLYSVIIQTILMTIILIPKQPIIDDVLSACLIGGFLCGSGVGLMLQAGASGGGVDILGMYFSMKKPGASVGKMYVVVNVIVFTLCAILFDLSISIYSVLYAVFMSFTMDRVHHQNINMSVMIFTKKQEIAQAINQQLKRGVTCWNGAGAYTNEDTYIFLSVISKYEVVLIKKIIKDIDPKAFVIFNEGIEVSGNFEKRL